MGRLVGTFVRTGWTELDHKELMTNNSDRALGVSVLYDMGTATTDFMDGLRYVVTWRLARPHSPETLQAMFRSLPAAKRYLDSLYSED